MFENGGNHFFAVNVWSPGFLTRHMIHMHAVGIIGLAVPTASNIAQLPKCNNVRTMT